MESVFGDEMVRRCCRCVVVTVVIVALLFVFLVFHGRRLFVNICPDSSQQPHNAKIRQSTEQFSEDALQLRTAVSFHNRSQLADFQHGAVHRTDNLPTVVVTTVTVTTKTKSRSPRQQYDYVLHRCPASYNINDTQDEWFRTQVVQRSPPTSQVSFTEEILIVTPIYNAERNLRRYFENLCSLAYPHRLVSVVLGEDSSNDKTVQVNCQQS